VAVLHAGSVSQCLEHWLGTSPTINVNKRRRISPLPVPSSSWLRSEVAPTRATLYAIA